MIIAGFQPLSLLDYPGIISSIVFTQGCAFRCGYCHNPELVPLNGKNTLHPETVVDYLRSHKTMIEGVCITGGEPTIHLDLPKFLATLKSLGLLVKLDTNGVHPRMIQSLIANRLVDFFAMDLKHAWNKYGVVIGHVAEQVIDQCRATFEIIQRAEIPHEFRTTIDPSMHTEEDIFEIAGMLLPGERYALQPVRYGKTLDPNLPQRPPMDLERLSREILKRSPDLHIEIRS